MGNWGEKKIEIASKYLGSENTKIKWQILQKQSQLILFTSEKDGIA